MRVECDSEPTNAARPALCTHFDTPALAEFRGIGAMPVTPMPKSATIYSAKKVAKGWDGPYQDEEGNDYYVNEALGQSCWAADVPLEEEKDPEDAAREGVGDDEEDVEDDDGLGDGFMITHKIHTERKKTMCDICPDDYDDDESGDEGATDDLVALMKSEKAIAPNLPRGDEFKYTVPSPWRRPTSERAERNAKEFRFESGEADFWKTSPMNMGEALGAGVWLYFSWLRGLIVCFTLMTIFHLPALLLCSSGAGTAEDDQDAFGWYKFTLGNVGVGPQSENGLFSETVSWLGSDYVVKDTGPVLGVFGTLGIFFALLPFWLWSRSETTRITNVVKTRVIKPEDYTVFVSRVPEDLDRTELGKFMSEKFDVNGGDWKGRDKDGPKPHGDRSPIVNSTSHLVGPNTNDADEFKGTGIADVQLVYSDATAIHAFILREKNVEELRRIRALCKMYAKSRIIDGKKTLKSFEASDPKRLRKYLIKEEELAAKLDTVAEKLDDKGKLLADDLNVIGAFVTFNSAIAADRCVSDFKSLNKKRKQVLYKLGCKKLPTELLYGENDHVLKVVRAPPPEDVIWESMRFEMFPKLRRYLQYRSNAAVLLVLLVSFISITVITTLSENASDTLPTRALCEMSAPAMFLDSSSVTTDDICKTSLGMQDAMRPAFGSSERSSWDANCDSALEDSKFIVYTNGADATTYLDASNIVNYADASNIVQLTTACSNDECPSDQSKKCPCLKSTNSDDIDGCSIKEYEYDGETCEVTGDKILEGNLLATCYCQDIMVNTVAEEGLFNGVSKAYETDGDFCTTIFTIYTAYVAFQILTSVITAIVNRIIEMTCSFFADHEGHINYETKELKMMQRNLWSCIFNTIGIPLIVAGRPTQSTWGIYIFDGSYKDMMRVADDDAEKVERGWYSDIGSEFVTTFLIMAFFECYGPLMKFHKFLAQKKAYKKIFSEKKAKEEVKKPGKFAKCCRFLRMGFGVEHPPFALQSDVDKFFMPVPFRFEDRYTQVLCLLSIVLMIGPSVPILFPLGVATLLCIYLVDKYLVVKYHSRPEIKIGRSLQDTINSYFIWFILAHTGFAGWAYSNDVLSERWDESSTTSTGTIQEKFEFKSAYPLIPAGMVVVASILLLPEKAGPGIIDSLKMALRFKKHDSVNTALFSETFELSMPDVKDGVNPISTHDHGLGFRFDTMRKLKYMERPPSKGAASPTKDKKMKTWQVIHKNGLHTYYRGANLRYENAIAALEEAQETVGNDADDNDG